MGTSDLALLPSQLPANSNVKSYRSAPETSGGRSTQHPDHRPRLVDSVGPNREQAVANSYENAIYRSLETRQALSLQLLNQSAQLGFGEDGGSARIQSSQLNFEFLQETRYEELALFNQRTNAVGEGLHGADQSRFLATREEISVRFDLSLSISGAALEGFASTAEGASGSNALLDRLLALSDKLLGEADALFNDFFSLLDGGFGEFNAQSLQDLFSEFLSGIYDTLGEDFLAALNPAGNGAGGDGGTVATSSSIQLEFSFEFSASISTSQQVVKQGDPLVLDLDDDGVELSTYQNGARFDLLGAGRAQQVAFVQGGDAFLALDRNGDGVINDGRELFGEQHGARNGFEELKRFDDNGDGVIDKNDAVFNELRLFRDNGNGITEAGELISLAEAGIVAIDLGYRETDERAAGGNRIAQIASFLRSNGSRGQAADALLNYIA